jgi:RHS repeat-associated protein
MIKHFVTILIFVAALLTAVAGEAQVTISGSTKVASGSSSCYSASTTCTTKTFCWSGSGLSSITPENSCSGGGGGPAVVKAETFVPNTGGGGSSCHSPAMALVAFPAVTTTTTAYIYIMNYCSIQNTLAVTIVPPPVAPTVSPSSQTVICSATPTALTIGNPQGGDGTYAYQWYSSPDNSTWTAISGATASSYMPPAPTVGTTMHYRLQLGSFGMTANSASVSVGSVPPVLVPGTITPASQTILTGTTPLQLQGPVSSGGACGTVTYAYLWYASTDGSNFSSTGVTSQNYTFSSGISANMWYKRLTSISGGPSGYSNTVTITVYPPVTGGTITGPASTVTYDTTLALYNGSLPTGGNCGGVYLYQWWKSTDGGNSFSQVASAPDDTLPTETFTSQALFYRQVSCNGLTAKSNTITVNVAPPLASGDLSPASLSIPVGASPGVLSYTPPQGGNCGGNYGYVWQSSTDGISWSTIGGITGLTYNPGALSTSTYFRIQTVCGASNGYTTAYITVGTTASDQNYVRTRTIVRPGITDTTSAGLLSDPYDVQQVIQYLDGLGRAMQTVAKAASPLGKDMVTTQTYDAFGRVMDSYLPYTDSFANGNFKPGALAVGEAFNSAMYAGENFPYAHVDYEPSPLGRPLISYSAGNSWVGSDRGVASGYFMNQLSDSVHIWNPSYTSGGLPSDGGLYAAQTLVKTTSTDEQGHQVVEYKDKDGQVLLKKVQLASIPGTAHVGWLCTYYVYDDFHRLRFVFSPRAVEVVNTGSGWSVPQGVADELCYRYEYDLRGRMIVKKVPGAGETHMVYDERDRLVMTQDANLRAQEKWMFSCYDVLNRPDSTGLMTDPANYGNLAWHVSQAMQSSVYPVLSGYATELLTRTFYDGYTDISAASSLPGSMTTGVTANGNAFITGYNNYPQYAVQPAAYVSSVGEVTGTMTKVIGSTNSYLYSESFYDDHGRPVQVFSLNYTGGVDTLTTQYDFNGKPLRTLLGVAKQSNGAQYHRVITKTNYDAGFRVTSTWQNLDGAAQDQIIDSMKYDELSRLKTKYLGKSVVTGLPLDSLAYDYNIRGWLTGINKNYLTGTAHYFGMELAYDNRVSVAGTMYANTCYNGNIAGTVWKTAGDRMGRKYDFYYDNVNRILNAFSAANVSGTTWNNSTENFNMVGYNGQGVGYDANGNITSMLLWGIKNCQAGEINGMHYTYTTNSNKLQQVADDIIDNNTPLGNFHYDPATKTSTDYAYDGNGNLTLDNNKKIDLISCNYLNLPQLEHFNGKGNIVYTYDAGGNKLQKQTIDSVAGMATTTLYLDGFQYQRRTPIASLSGGTDTLQFMSEGEGRVRWAYHKHLAGDSAYAWEYDFMEKDHLGNTRVLLTQERDTAQYVATMERAYRSTEDALFYNIDSTSYATSAVPGGFPAEPNGTSPNDSVAKVDGAGVRMGPALLLKVMSGDSIGVGVYSYYTGTGTAGTPNSSFNNVLNSLASGLVGMTGASHGGFSTLAGSSSAPVYSSLNSFLQDSDANTTTKPKAYLNWMLLDNQFHYVGDPGQSGAIPVGASGQLNTLGTSIKLAKSGYLYIWVSNETPNWPVFFDNLSVVHYTGPMLEEDHYYPYGLQMAGLCDKAVKTQYAQNKYRYNGKELQNAEFSDGSGLEENDYGARLQDPQLGIWHNIDSKAEKYPFVSPYCFAIDNPTKYIDFDGNEIGNPTDQFTKKVEAYFNKTEAGRNLWDQLVHSKRTIYFVDNSHWFKTDEGKKIHSAMSSSPGHHGNASMMSEPEYEAAKQGIHYDYKNSMDFDASTGLYDKTSDYDNTYLVFDGYGGAGAEVITLARNQRNVDASGDATELALLLIMGEEAYHALQNTSEIYKRKYNSKTKKYEKNENTPRVEHDDREEEKEAGGKAVTMFLQRIDDYLKDHPGAIEIKEN